MDEQSEHQTQRERLERSTWALRTAYEVELARLRAENARLQNEIDGFMRWRVVRALVGWQRIHASLRQLSPARMRQLRRTATLTLRRKGAGAVIRRGMLWLSGRRGYWRDLAEAAPPSNAAASAKMRIDEPLVGSGDAPPIEIGAPNGRSALILAPSVPAYDRESGARRLDHLIGLLRSLGWAVALRVETLDGGDSYLPRLRAAGVDVGLFGTPPPILPDLILIQFWGVAEAHLPRLRAVYPSAKILIDSVDLHFVREVRSGDYAGAGTTFGRELAAYRAADGTLTVSQKEADWLTDLLPGSNVYLLPLMETFAPSPIPFAERRGVVFLGSFRHQPNVDALDWLLRQIVPLLDPDLLTAHPLSIIGYGLHEYAPAYAALQLHGVEMVGAVESVVPYLERARVMAAPLRFGAGTKGKLLQAALIGTPSVTTRIGVEGLPLEHDQSILIADDAPTFAAALTRLLSDGALWKRLSETARQQTEAQHSRKAVMARWRAVLSALGFDHSA